MILRRLAEGIRQQDWFTVVLEILIVVVGIFLGLQVDDWNEHRKERAQETAYLAQLQDDVETMRSLLDGLIARAEGREEAMLRVLRALETCSAEFASETDFQRTFTEYQNILNVQVLDATYNEMLASGALAGLGHLALRRAIPELFTRLDVFNSTVPQIRGTLPTVDAIVWENVRLSYDKDGQIVLTEYNFDQLCSKPAVQNAVVEMIDMQRDWQNTANEVAVRVVDLEAQLKEVTGSTPASR